MFVRNVTLKLRKGAEKDLKQIAETEILPVLRRQNGFRDEIICVAPQRLEALVISFWETKEAAEAFEKTAYPNVVKSVSNLIDGTPKVDHFELLLSTLDKIAAKA